MFEKDDRPIMKTRLKLLAKPKEDNIEDRFHHTWIVLDHCFIKGCQAGSLMALAVGPIAFYLMKYRRGFLVQKTLNLTIPGALIGGVASTALGAGILRNQPDEAVFDRAYRLYHNEAQNRSDVFSLGGAVVGAAAAWRLPINYAAGACAGFGLGVVGHMVCKPYYRREGPLVKPASE